MKIEQVHIKHKTWYTRVTVGEGEDAKMFGLQHLRIWVTPIKRGYGEPHRVHVPFGSTNATTYDFATRETALAFCESKGS